MSEAFFSNRPPKLTAEGLRQSIDRALGEIDRVSALPAGDPELCRMWGCDQKVPVPVEVFEEVRSAEAAATLAARRKVAQARIQRVLEADARAAEARGESMVLPLGYTVTIVGASSEPSVERPEWASKQEPEDEDEMQRLCSVCGQSTCECTEEGS